MLAPSTTHPWSLPGGLPGGKGLRRAGADGERRHVGAYVHFPWCLAKCPYCDFVSFVTPEIDHRGYADAVLREIEARAGDHGQGALESIFFGGGTPSLWDARELGRVLDGVRGAFGAEPGGAGELEITVECNPTSLDEERAAALVRAGVTRVSIGVQSLRDERLEFLGRLHDAKGAVAAVRGAERAGVERISADLIFGLPGQSPEESRDEALELVGLGLSHVSCYQLTIEPGTRFGELARRGRLPLADEGAVAEGFLAIDEALTAAGFGHYEVSNYARAGQEARHNLGYWRGDDYVGLGCAAYGCARVAGDAGEEARGQRWRNLPGPDAYVEATRRPKGDRIAAIHESVEPLDAETLLRERLMLGLRIAEGIDLERAGRDLGIAGFTAKRERAVAWLEGRGRIVREGGVLRVPRGAWLWTDDTAARLF
jgi:oxygen-independent coproporphyrinogen-3 oxidase